MERIEDAPAFALDLERPSDERSADAVIRSAQPHGRGVAQDDFPRLSRFPGGLRFRQPHLFQSLGQQGLDHGLPAYVEAGGPVIELA